MKVGMQTWGSDGDILPFIALAKGLVDKGHSVALAYTSADGKDYDDLGSSFGIEMVRANGAPAEGDLYALTTSQSPFYQLSALFKKCYEPVTGKMFEASIHVAKNSDLLIGHTLSHTLLTAADKYKKPFVSVALTPQVIQTRYRSPFGTNFSTPINSLCWTLGDMIMTQAYFKNAKLIRKKQGLPPLRSLYRQLFRSRSLTLIAVSASLCERERDWDANIQICGSLEVPSVQQSDLSIDELDQFIASGTPPIFMTFGSCMQFKESEDLELLTKAAEKAGVRAIVQTFSHQASKNDSVFFVQRVPHALIFPKCALVVHHGGAGTTQAVLRAGVPSITVAHAYDQPYWGKLMQRSGVSPGTFLRSRVTSEQIADMISEVLVNSNYAINAGRAGHVIRSEGGVARAVEILHEKFGDQ